MKLLLLLFTGLTLTQAHAEQKTLEGFVRLRGADYVLDVEEPLSGKVEYKLRGNKSAYAKHKNLFVKANGDFSYCQKSKCLANARLTPTLYDPLKNKGLSKKPAVSH